MGTITNAIVAISIFFIMPQAKAVEFYVTNLTLGGQLVSTNGTPHINGRGDVSVNVLDSATNDSYAALWQSGQPGELISGTGSGDTRATGVNDSGTIVGWGDSYPSNFGSSGATVAGFRAQENGAVEYYPINPAQGTGFQPQAINSAGVMAGTQGFTSLRVLGAGVDRSYRFGNNLVASAVNESNQVAGFYIIGHLQEQAGMFYDDGDTVHTYEDVLGRQDLRGLDVNDSGVIAGVSRYTADQEAAMGYPDKQEWAFTFNNGNFNWLPGLDDYFLNAQAMALNNNGWVVGISQSAGTDFDATLWIDGRPMDLNALTTNLPNDMYLVYATDVNDSGQIAALARAADGNLYPVLLTPTAPIPEPVAALSPLLSLIALGRQRKC